MLGGPGGPALQPALVLVPRRHPDDLARLAVLGLNGTSGMFDLASRRPGSVTAEIAEAMKGVSSGPSPSSACAASLRSERRRASASKAMS